MRTISAAQQAVINAGTQAEFVRVQVKDLGGTFRDLTTYPGFNAVKEVKWTEQIDNPHATFDITLFREQYQLSLSPYVQGSAVNLAFVYPGSFSALLALNRELKIEVAIVPTDTRPTAGDWFEVFHGRIETIDAAKDQDIEVTGTALSGRLSKQYIKTELVYSLAAVAGVAVPLRVWEPGIAVTTSPLVYCLPASRGDGSGGGTADPGFNKFVKCSQAGTTGLAEPVWTTGAGQVDGTAKWDYVGAPTTAGNPVEQIMQNIMTDNLGTGDTALTLFTPSSPGWNISQFIQQREFTMDAITTLATQIGWDIRTKWRSASSQFELTFYQPTRSAPSVDHVFAKNEYAAPGALKVDMATIRNKIRVIYPDAVDLWPDGTPKRKTIEVSDSGSITKYGEMWCELQEDQTTNIDTSAEATTFANACLSDCKEPTAELDVPLVRGFPWVELNDYYTFSANGLQFDSDQSLAVTQYQHESHEGKGLRTSVQTRGLPTIGARKYLGMSVHPKIVKKQTPHRLVHYNGLKTPSAILANTVGGQRVTLAQSFDKVQVNEEYEHHVYPVSGTTLGASTLVAIAKDRVIEVANLIPGKQYYHKVVARFRNGDQLVRSQPSVEAGFVAGQAAAGHIQGGIALGWYPLNGGFETRTDPNGLPDHWTMFGGVYGTDVVVMEDGNGISGNRYLRLATHSGGVRSALIPLLNERASLSHGSMYRMTWWRKAAVGNTAGAIYAVLVRALDSAGSEVDTYTAGSGLPCDNKNGTWVKEQVYVELAPADASARSIQIEIVGSAGATLVLDIDEFRIEHIGTVWYNVGAGGNCDNGESVPAFANSWGNFNAGTDKQASFRRDQFGRVALGGRISGGTVAVGTEAFALPLGYRPPLPKRFSVPGIPHSHVRGKRAAALAIVPGGTVLQCDTENWDTGNEFDITTNKGRFTATYAGYYFVSAHVLFTSTAWLAAESMTITVRKNGVTNEINGGNVADANVTAFLGTGVSGTVLLAAGDYLEVLVSHTHGVNINTHNDGTWNYFCVDRVDTAAAVIEVLANGKVCVVEGQNADICLDGISFITW